MMLACAVTSGELSDVCPNGEVFMDMHRPVATARAVAAPALLFLFLLPW